MVSQMLTANSVAWVSVKFSNCAKNDSSLELAFSQYFKNLLVYHCLMVSSSAFRYIEKSK